MWKRQLPPETLSRPTLQRRTRPLPLGDRKSTTQRIKDTELL
jgi:hypothetical protein